jgi:hypothetical protein
MDEREIPEALIATPARSVTGFAFTIRSLHPELMDCIYSDPPRIQSDTPSAFCCRHSCTISLDLMMVYDTVFGKLLAS